MRPYHMIKRLFDIFLSVLGIIILSPLFILLSLWIKAASPGPAIYKHTRIGKNGSPFEIYKFRSMVVGARDLQLNNVPDSELITRPGRFMRKTFLDEIPQLFNILKGDISLVGPRPLDKEVFEKLIKRDKGWLKIIKIKPGLTSLESVADYMDEKKRIDFQKKFKGLKDKGRIKDFYEHRLLLDLYYAENESFFMDAKIVADTFFLMLKKIFLK